MATHRQAHLLPRDALGRDLFHPGSLTAVRRGSYVRTSEWDALFVEGKLITLARAVDARRRSPVGIAYAYATAAACHGLPVYRVRADRIDLIVPGDHTRQDSSDVVRHHVPLPDDDVVTIDGLRVTSLERTVYDVIRTTSLETAVTCFDAALRAVAWDDGSHTYDEVAAAEFREAVWRRIRAHSGARGIRQARFVADFADGRAQLPGESISRLWMHLLGAPAPVLQLRVDLPGGRIAYLDFAWPQLGRWGEFDGVFKYEDPDLLAGRTRDEVLVAQGEREWAVGTATGWSNDRWGFDRMPDIETFAAFLRGIHLI